MDDVTYLLKHRLHWYWQTMAEKLLRFKQVLLLIVVLCIPSLQLLVTLVSEPLLWVAKPSVQPGVHYFVGLWVIQIVYLGWIIGQKASLFPTVVKSYLGSLPIGLAKNHIIRVLMLLIANHLLWIPFICATVQLKTEFMPQIRLLAFACSILGLQALWFTNPSRAVLLSSISNGLLYLSCLQASVLPILGALAFASISLLFCFRKPQARSSDSAIRFSSLWQSSPWLALSVASLWHNHRMSLFTRLGLCAGIMSLGGLILHRVTQLDPFAWTFITAMSILLIINSFFPLLKETRNDYGFYLHALPYSRKNWYLQDGLLIIGLSILLINAYCFHLKTSGLMTAFISLLTLPLGIALGLIRNGLPRQGSWIAISITYLYCFLVITGWSKLCN